MKLVITMVILFSFLLTAQAIGIKTTSPTSSYKPTNLPVPGSQRLLPVVPPITLATRETEARTLRQWLSRQATERLQQRVPGQATERLQRRVPGQVTERLQQRVPGQATERPQRRVPGQATERLQQRVPGQATDTTTSKRPLPLNQVDFRNLPAGGIRSGMARIEPSTLGEGIVKVTNLRTGESIYLQAESRAVIPYVNSINETMPKTKAR